MTAGVEWLKERPANDKEAALWYPEIAQPRLISQRA